MALYNFHRVLIAAAILFAIGFCLYCVRNYQSTGDVVQLVMLIVLSIVTVGLVGYLIHFNKNLTVLRHMLTMSVPCRHCGCDLTGAMAAGRTVCPECGSEVAGGTGALRH